MPRYGVSQPAPVFRAWHCLHGTDPSLGYPSKLFEVIAGVVKHAHDIQHFAFLIRQDKHDVVVHQDLSVPLHPQQFVVYRRKGQRECAGRADRFLHFFQQLDRALRRDRRCSEYQEARGLVLFSPAHAYSPLPLVETGFVNGLNQPCLKEKRQGWLCFASIVLPPSRTSRYR